MTPHRPLRGALLAVLLVLAATAARGETAWDQARVTSLSKSLVGAVDDLYDAFFKQPRVVTTPSAIRNYDRLKRDIRLCVHVLRREDGARQTLEEIGKYYEPVELVPVQE